jgi:hypothetical protein
MINAKKERIIICLKKFVLIMMEYGMKKKRYARLKMRKKKQLIKTMFARNQKILMISKNM